MKRTLPFTIEKHPYASTTLHRSTVGWIKSWHFTLYIYDHKLGHPESLIESPSTSISSSGAFVVNLENLAMTQVPGWQPAAKHLQCQQSFLPYYKNLIDLT